METLVQDLILFRRSYYMPTPTIISFGTVRVLMKYGPGDYIKFKTHGLKAANQSSKDKPIEPSRFMVVAVLGEFDGTSIQGLYKVRCVEKESPYSSVKAIDLDAREIEIEEFPLPDLAEYKTIVGASDTSTLTPPA